MQGDGVEDARGVEKEPAYVSIRQNTSAYVSTCIRQHTSEYGVEDARGVEKQEALLAEARVALLADKVCVCVSYADVC